MEVLKYLVEVVKWEESPWESYADLSASMGFSLVLSPPDDADQSFSYFAVSPMLKVTNGSGHNVFVGETKSTVRLTNNGTAPTPEILFEIIIEATRDFAKTFKERTEHNPRIYHTIPKPAFNNLQSIIEDSIEKAYPSWKRE
jgi:hypothetical protein